MADAGQGRKQLQQIGFMAAAAGKVGINRLGDGQALFAQHFGQTLQAVLPQRPRHFGLRIGCPAQAVK